MPARENNEWSQDEAAAFGLISGCPAGRNSPAGRIVTEVAGKNRIPMARLVGRIMCLARVF